MRQDSAKGTREVTETIQFILNDKVMLFFVFEGLSYRDLLTYLSDDEQDVERNHLRLHTVLSFMVNASIEALIDGYSPGITHLGYFSNTLIDMLIAETQENIQEQYLCYCNGGHFRNNWFDWAHFVQIYQFNETNGVIDFGYHTVSFSNDTFPFKVQEPFPTYETGPLPIHHTFKKLGIGYPIYYDKYYTFDGITFSPKWYEDRKYIPFTEITKNGNNIFKRCLALSNCPPLILHILLHGEESFLDLPVLQNAKDNPICNDLNYALHLENIQNELLPGSSLYCTENHISELVQWLRRAPKIKFLEISNWQCLCTNDYSVAEETTKGENHPNHCTELFNLLFHNQLQYIKIEGIEDVTIQQMLLQRIPKMENLKVFVFKNCEKCVFDISQPLSLRVFHAERFSSIISVPDSIHSLILGYVYQDVEYSYLYVPGGQFTYDSSDPDSISSNFLKALRIGWNITKNDKPESASFWLHKDYPNLRHLAISSYGNKSGFDLNDFVTLRNSFNKGKFPQLQMLRVINCNLSGSWSILKSFLEHTSLSTIILKNTNLTKGDGKKLLQQIKAGHFSAGHAGKCWDFTGNENLKSIEQDLKEAAYKYNIQVYVTDGPWQSQSPFMEFLSSRGTFSTKSSFDTLKKRYVP